MMEFKKNLFIFLTICFIACIINSAALAVCIPPCDGCRICVNFNCIWNCPSGYTCCGSGLSAGCCNTSHKCVTCDGGKCKWCDNDPNKFCCDDQKCCDRDKCEECVDGDCKVCGGDPDMKCCDGGYCVPKCNIIDGESCNGDLELGCSCAMGEECAPPSTRTVWSGATEKICSPRGCEGDCSDDTQWCSRMYQCEKTLDYTPCAICSNLVEGPGGIPYPGLIYNCYPLEPFQNRCYSCEQGVVIDETTVDNDSCN